MIIRSIVLFTGASKSTDSASEASLDVGACCLCHCALDYSDRAAFYRDDRFEDYNDDSDEEEYFFRPKDPFLDESLYDANNALVYCDSCERMYHQKCHFVPLTLVPRGRWHCMVCQAAADSKKKLESTDTAKLFMSPPHASMREAERTWEEKTAHRKALAWRSEFKRLRQHIQLQFANFRHATAALETLTGTQRNRKHFHGSSQEMAQTLHKLATAKWRLRQVIENLDDIRQSTDQRWRLLMTFANECDEEFCRRVLFPFGRSHPHRIVPRTPEMAEDEKAKADAAVASSETVPTEIILDRKTGKCAKSQSSEVTRESKATKDDDSGISLDDLKCCICLANDATDDNDLILCDGKGCYRAYHMQCVVPHVKPDEVGEENDDWFCPLCQALAELMLLIQSEYMGDDWEQRRLQRAIDGRKKPEMGEEDSLKSWDAVEDVFPDAKWQFETATKLREGVRNAATNELLRQVLGTDDIGSSGTGEGADDDDDEEDEHFDPEAFEAARRKIREEEEDDGDDSTHSSQATLVEMSSVELEIGKDELAALSEDDDSENEGSSGDDSEDSTGSSGGYRRSRRLRKLLAANENGSDIGKLDEHNIISGKRGRKPVDYRKLNDAMFGDLPASEVASIDDNDEFVAKRSFKSMSDDDSSDESGDDEDNDASDSQSASSNSADEESSHGNASSSRTSALSSDLVGSKKSQMHNGVKNGASRKATRALKKAQSFNSKNGRATRGATKTRGKPQRKSKAGATRVKAIATATVDVEKKPTKRRNDSLSAAPTAKRARSKGKSTSIEVE